MTWISPVYPTEYWSNVGELQMSLHSRSFIVQFVSLLSTWLSSDSVTLTHWPFMAQIDASSHPELLCRHIHVCSFEGFFYMLPFYIIEFDFSLLFSVWLGVWWRLSFPFSWIFWPRIAWNCILHTGHCNVIEFRDQCTERNFQLFYFCI